MVKNYQGFTSGIECISFKKKYSYFVYGKKALMFLCFSLWLRYLGLKTYTVSVLGWSFRRFSSSFLREEQGLEPEIGYGD